MKAKDLKERLANVPDDKEVTLAVGDFYGMLHSVHVRGEDVQLISSTGTYRDDFEEGDEEDYHNGDEDPDFEPVVPSNEMLEIERRIIQTVEARGWKRAEDEDVFSNGAVIRKWTIEIDGMEYNLYVEPWDKRSCAKYNIIEEGDRHHNDLEWDEEQGEEVLKWFAAHPTVAAPK